MHYNTQATLDNKVNEFLTRKFEKYPDIEQAASDTVYPFHDGSRERSIFGITH